MLGKNLDSEKNIRKNTYYLIFLNYSPILLDYSPISNKIGDK